MKEKGFEELLTELEEIATKLEKDDLTLDESIKQFENGMKIAKVCNEKLEETGLCAPKVTYLMNKLSERGMPVDKNTIIVDEAIKQLYELLK